MRALGTIRRTSGRTSSTWRLKKVLASLIVVGSLTFFTVNGVFAVFNSEARNTSSKIASGTLTMSNTVATGTACLSNTASSKDNANAACTALFTASSLHYPGDSATVHLTITNTGSADASDLTFWSSACSTGQSAGASAAGVSYTGDLCAAGGLELYVQETNSSWTPLSSCAFPASTTTSCAFTANTLKTFSVNHTSTAPVDLGESVPSTTSRYFVIGVMLPSTASYTLQGRQVTFGITWAMNT